MLEVKTISEKVDVVDMISRTVVFYAAAFGSVDSHGDIIQKGAFSKTIKENKHRIKYLWNHNTTNVPVGVINEMEEDDRGLKITATLMSSALASDLLECYQKGAVTEHSIGFFTRQSKSGENGNRILTEVELLECSAVLWGSNENTPLIGLKSENREDLLKELDRRSQKLYKSLASGNLSEEALQLRALEHVHIHKAMIDLYEMSLKKEEPIEVTVTLIPDEPIDMKSIEQTQLEELNQFYMAFRK